MSLAEKALVVKDRFDNINAFVDVTIRSLTRAEALIWLTIWRDTRHGYARTSYSSLAKTCGCRRATVTVALRRLREKGLIEIVRRGGRGIGANIYRVRPFAPVDPPEWNGEKEYPPMPPEMFSIREVRSMKPFSGVYFAVDEAGVVQYVGKSRNLPSRVRSGRDELRGCRISALRMPQNEIHFAELHYIARYRPARNKVGNDVSVASSPE